MMSENINNQMPNDLYVTWRNKAVELLRNWQGQETALELTEFTYKYLLALIKEENIRLLIAGTDNIIRFNRSITVDQANKLADALSTMEYGNIDDDAIDDFILKMRSHNLSGLAISNQ